MRDRDADQEFQHALRNQIGVIVGFADLLLADLPGDDPRASDVHEIQRAARAALALIDARQTERGVSEAYP